MESFIEEADYGDVGSEDGSFKRYKCSGPFLTRKMISFSAKIEAPVFVIHSNGSSPVDFLML
jgi:hypothetical protein